jgi:hypothetical protein
MSVREASCEDVVTLSSAYTSVSALIEAPAKQSSADTCTLSVETSVMEPSIRETQRLDKELERNGCFLVLPPVK